MRMNEGSQSVNWSICNSTHVSTPNHKCFVCDIGFANMNRFITHMSTVHLHHNRLFKCTTCNLKLPNRNRYEQHFLDCPSRSAARNVYHEDGSALTPEITSQVGDQSVLPELDNLEDFQHTSAGLFTKTAHLCLDLMANHRVPEVAIAKVVHHIGDVCEGEGGNEIKKLLLSSSSRREIFQKCFNFIRPMEVNVNGSTIGYILPMKDTLEQTLRVPIFQENIFRPHISPEDLAINFRDGNQIHHHPILGANISALQIILYVDDLEICNPVGSSKKIHKLSMFYYTLGNIEPHMKSSLSSISLLAVAKCELIQKNETNLNALLKDFLDTICKLRSDGITLYIGGASVKMKGDLLCILSDSLAGNWLGGFKSSFSPKVRRPCHVCETLSSEFPATTRHSHSQPRNEESHLNRCASLDRIKDSKNRRFWSTRFGISSTSVLSAIPSFPICQSLLRDPMHLLFEGLFPLEIGLLLSHFGCERIISLEQINSAILSHKLHYTCECDKFQILTSLTHFSMKSAQMWNFAIHLPLFVSQFICHHSEHWKSYIMLLQISQILTSPFITSAMEVRLTDLIEKHHRLFCTLYPQSITPKLHFLIHLPQQMKDFGPSRHHWCFRMESMHQNAKMRRYNFRNICMSVAEHMSLKRSATLFNDQGRSHNLKEVFKPVKPFFPHCLHVDGVEKAGYRCSTMISSTIKLKKLSFIYTHSIMEHPICQISDLFISNEGFLFLTVRECVTAYDNHRNGLTVTHVLPDQHIISHASLVYPWPLIDAEGLIISKSLFLSLLGC
jgi:hypothetical protein